MDDNNGKRELGEIQSTLKHISSDINGMRSDIKDLRNKITNHCIETEGLKTKVSDNKDEIDRLRKRTDVWSGVNSVMAFIAGLIGINQ